MSPESYVLLLIGCWLLLASTTLWGILRVTRRHYLEPVENLSDPEPQPARELGFEHQTRHSPISSPECYRSQALPSPPSARVIAVPVDKNKRSHWLLAFRILNPLL